MSAYELDKKHFVYLVEAAISRKLFDHSHLTWIIKNKEGEYISNNLTNCDTEKSIKIANMLLQANIESVQYRYNDNDNYNYNTEITPEEYDTLRSKICIFDKPEITPIQVLKAIDGYIYQSCEYPEFYDNEAYAFVSSLRETAIMALAGYNEALWSIS